jgi:predicted methyltransferase
MNIADKERLYAGIHRVLRPGGLLALQEPMAGPVQPPVFPLMWARDASTSFLRPPEAMRALIARAGFVERAWQDVTAETAGPATAESVPAHSANHVNRAEGRMVSIQALFERP